MRNKTVTFEDGMKLKEYKCVKEYEEYTDKAFEELCGPEAGMCRGPWKPEMRRDILPAVHHSPRPHSSATSLSLCWAERLVLCHLRPRPCSVLSPASSSMPSSFLIICWKAPWTSPTSLANSAFVHLNFRAFSSR